MRSEEWPALLEKTAQYLSAVECIAAEIYAMKTTTLSRGLNIDAFKRDVCACARVAYTFILIRKYRKVGSF